MSKSIAKSTLSAPVVQSRLEHHHNQQLHSNHQPRNKQIINHKRSGSKSTKSKRHSHLKEHSPSSTSTPIPRNSRGDDLDIDRDFSIEQDHCRLAENMQNSDEARPGKQSNLQRKSSNGRNNRKCQSDSNDEQPVQRTILKRSQSITDFTKPSPSSNRSCTDEDATVRQPKFVRSTPPSPTRPQSSKDRRRCSEAHLSKAKRIQCRRDVKSFNDVDSLLVSTPSQSQNKDTFTTNVNSITTTTNFPFNQNTRMPVTPLKLVNSDVLPPFTHNTRRRMSSTAIEIKQHAHQFSDSKSSSDLKSVRHNRPASTPAKQQQAQLYAGPDFHNAPAPSDLPLPSFGGKSLGRERPLLEDTSFVGLDNFGNNGFRNIISTVNSSPSTFSSPPLTPPTPRSPDHTYNEDLFIMDDVNVVSNNYDDAYIRQQQSIQLKMMLASSKQKHDMFHNVSTAHQQSAPIAYNVPQKMATARPLHVYNDSQGMSLTEISESLRSLLKISGH